MDELLPILTVELVERGGSDRLGRPERFVVRCGYPVRGRDSGKIRGGMVAVYFHDEDQLAGALKRLAQLWAENGARCRREAGLDGRIYSLGGH